MWESLTRPKAKWLIRKILLCTSAWGKTALFEKQMQGNVRGVCQCWCLTIGTLPCGVTLAKFSCVKLVVFESYTNNSWLWQSLLGRNALLWNIHNFRIIKAGNREQLIWRSNNCSRPVPPCEKSEPMSDSAHRFFQNKTRCPSQVIVEDIGTKVESTT